MNKNSNTSIKKQFIFVFILLIVYYLLTKIPFLPEEISGFSTKKLIKIFLGLAFVIGTFYLYLSHRKA